MINRRKFFKDTSLSAAGIMFGSSIVGFTSGKEPVISSYDIMKDVMKYRKIDSHAHVNSIEQADYQIDYADRLGIEFLSISRPLGASSLPISEVKPEEFIKRNDLIYSAMKKYPKRYISMFTLNPYFRKESLEEISRRVNQGFAGFKGHALLKINNPLYYPIIEKLIDLKMICMMHAECELGVAGYRPKYDIGTRPQATIPEDMVEVAKRYPEAMFQWAHLSSGDFEYICKAVKDYPNIYIDLSGSHSEERHVDYAIELLGVDRLFFGTDGSYYQGVGRILASRATESQKRKLFFDNYNNMLRKGGHNVA